MNRTEREIFIEDQPMQANNKIQSQKMKEIEKTKMWWPRCVHGILWLFWGTAKKNEQNRNFIVDGHYIDVRVEIFCLFCVWLQCVRMILFHSEFTSAFTSSWVAQISHSSGYAHKYQWNGTIMNPFMVLNWFWCSVQCCLRLISNLCVCNCEAILNSSWISFKYAFRACFLSLFPKVQNHTFIWVWILWRLPWITHKEIVI